MSEDSIILLLLILHVLAPLFLLYSTIGLYVTKIKLLSCDGSQINEKWVKLLRKATQNTKTTRCNGLVVYILLRCVCLSDFKKN